MCCRHCNEEFPDCASLYIHRKSIHGGDVSTLQDIPYENSPWVDSSDKDLESVYNLHKDIILQPHKKNDIVSSYNFPVRENVDIPEMMEQINLIYNDFDHSFKVNISMGLILKDVTDGRYRFFSPAKNTHVFDIPFYIKSQGKLKLII